jgi:hypothetical protein
MEPLNPECIALAYEVAETTKLPGGFRAGLLAACQWDNVSRGSTSVSSRLECFRLSPTPGRGSKTEMSDRDKGEKQMAVNKAVRLLWSRGLFQFCGLVWWDKRRLLAGRLLVCVTDP